MANRILVVDDEKDIVLMLKDYFELNGYEVLTAYNGTQALQKAQNQPDIILLDEPTSALDPELVTEVLNIIKKIAEQGYTMLLVSHEMDFIKKISSRVIFLDGGKIIEDGTPKEVFENPKSQRAKDFFGKMNLLKEPDYYI